MAEETIDHMLKAIESFALKLTAALEQNNKEAIKDSLYALRRQNWRLYRTAQRQKRDDIVNKTRKIAAQLAVVRRNANYPYLCIGHIGLIITLCRENTGKIQEITKAEYQRRVTQLRQWGFDITPYPKLVHFLVTHWDGTTEMANAAGEHINEIFRYSLHVVNYIIDERIWPMLVKGLPKMANAAGKNSRYIFEYGLSAVKFIINEKNFPSIVDYFIELLTYCKGTEKDTLYYISSTTPFHNLFSKFGVDLFELLIIPTAKAQTVASFLCFRSFGEITGFKPLFFKEITYITTIQTKEDLALLRFIVEKKSRKANDILKNIIIKGLEKRIIQTPLSKEANIIKEFLAQSPAYLIELYAEFKQIYLGNLPDKHIQHENLFKDVKQLKKEIVEGILTKSYNENIVLGVLYSLFSPEVSVDRGIYKRALESRTDRQSDIPSELDRLSGRKVRISKGGYILKEAVDTSSWNNLIESVNEVNRNRIKIIPPELGMNLMLEWRKDTLRAKQKEYLKQIYAFDVDNGNSLPDFNTNHETLMKYKEFIGDRLKNDLISSLLSKAQEEFPEQFSKLLGKAKSDYRALSKTLLSIWKSTLKDKEQKIKAILERNGFYIELLNWPAEITVEQINAQLISLSTNVIDKSIVQKIFNGLYGDQYLTMQKEMEKFEFKREGSSLFGAPFRFVLSKRKMHSVAMFNMGVCTAPDDKLWNSNDFWQMIIFDEEDNACGGVIYRTIYEDGKAYLIASIQPSSSILSSVSPTQTYEKIIQFSRLMARTLNYQNLLIPTSSTIHSNRGSIQAIISSRNYPEIELKHEYDFSYAPYHYKYKEFYIVV